MLEINNVYDIDCIEGMRQIEDKAIDMILCDLPYGVTSKNKWDNIIPFDLMWEQVERIIKDNGAILFFAQDKFTAKLMLSNERIHRYNIIWDKELPSGFLNANKQPLRSHEDIVVFYKKLPVYNPQKVKGNKCHSKGKSVGKDNDDCYNNQNYNNFKLVETEGDMKFPTSIWHFPKPHPSVSIHPTQKSLELCRYAIRTYTNMGDTVLDFCCGSGTTLKAAQLEGRNYIGMDNGICENKGQFKDWKWAEVSKYRLEKMEG